MHKFILQLNRLFLVVAGVILLLMMLQIGGGALFRSLFKVAFDGNIEIAKFYYMVTLCALPLAAVQASKEHVIVEVFTQGMRPTARRVLDWCALLFTTLYAAVLAVGCTFAALEATEAGEFAWMYVFELPTWPSRWILAVGLFGFLLTAVYMLCSRKEKLTEGAI